MAVEPYPFSNIMKLDLWFYPYTGICSKLVKDLHVQGRTVKRVEDTVEADHDDLSAGTDFLKKKQEQKP